MASIGCQILSLIPRHHGLGATAAEDLLRWVESRFLMRILHVIPYMHPSAGGPPVVVRNFVRETNKRGHSSAILSTTLLCAGDDGLLLDDLNTLAPTKLIPASLVLGFGRAGRKQLHQSIAAADIVHVHTLWSPINRQVRTACSRYGKPYVLMPHGMLDPYSLSVKAWRKRLYRRLIEDKNIECAARIVFTTSEEARLAALQIPSLPGRDVVLPLGGDPPDIEPDHLRHQFNDRFKNPGGRPHLLFLGRLHHKKGIDRIISALPDVIKAFPDVLLTIAGDGTKEYCSSLIEVISSKQIQRNVLVTGSLHGPVKWGAFASAHLFLLPSRQENFAITIAEAMHMSVPVVISEKVNTWPYIVDADAGVVLSEDGIVDGLITSIVSLLRDVECRQAMGQRGREYARSNLTWAKSGDRLLECYDDVLSK